MAHDIVHGARHAGWALLLGVATVLAASPRNEETPALLERFEFRKVAMGVEARLVFFADDARRAQDAAAAAMARIDALDDALSDWRADSELSRLCAAAGRGPVPVSADLYDAMERALDWARRTDGAFDPTLGTLSRLWRRARDEGVDPDPRAWDEAARLAGAHHVRLDPSTRSIEIVTPGVRLDLGGIGKGLAADAALAVLREHGIHAALVEMGGDLALGEPPPGRDGWSVDAGCGEQDGPPRRGTWARCGVATSGDSEQSLWWDGVRVTHLVDPRGGRPLPAGMCCTVVAPSGADADVLASAGRVLGPRGARALLGALPGVLVFVEQAGQRPLFDGATLAGWTEVPEGRDARDVGDDVVVEPGADASRDDADAGDDADADATWTTVDGVLALRGGTSAVSSRLVCAQPLMDGAFDAEVRCAAHAVLFVDVIVGRRDLSVVVTCADGVAGVGPVPAGDAVRWHPDATTRDAPAPWRHVEVELDARAARWTVHGDGRLVGERPLGDAGAERRLGLQVRCDAGTGPSVLWRALRMRDLSAAR